MSRTYKKAIEKYAPKDGSWGKRQANKKVRRTKNIQDGMAYKKVFCSWDIHDCTWDTRFDRDTYFHRHWKTGKIQETPTWIFEKKNSKKMNGCWYITK